MGDYFVAVGLADGKEGLQLPLRAVQRVHAFIAASGTDDVHFPHLQYFVGVR